MSEGRKERRKRKREGRKRRRKRGKGIIDDTCYAIDTFCSDSLLYFFLFLSTLHSVYTRDCSCKF